MAPLAGLSAELSEELSAEGHVGNVAQQGLAQLFLHFAGIAEAVVEPVAQKPSPHPSHNAQH